MWFMRQGSCRNHRQDAPARTCSLRFTGTLAHGSMVDRAAQLFAPQNMAGKRLPWISRATMPMFLLTCLAVALIYVFPGIVSWLPQQMGH